MLSIVLVNQCILNRLVIYMSTNFFISHTIICSNGERLPLLLYRDSFQPAILATRYIINERREKRRVGTLLRDVRILEWFYEWSYNNGLDLESRLRQGNNLTPSEVTGFCRYLRDRRNSKLIESNEQNGHPVLSPTSFNAYIRIIEDFLIWAAYEYLPFITPRKKNRDTLEDVRERIHRAFHSNKILGRLPRKRYGLSQEQIIKIRKAIEPGSTQNPYKLSVQFRNYVIIELLLATGIRRGELLKIKLTHLPRGTKTTLSIEGVANDETDSRRQEPQIKTLDREIPIPKTLAISLWEYVKKCRKKGNHPFLFTSNRNGKPLDLGGVNWIFEILVKRCFPDLKGNLYPHSLRHTFNNLLLEKSIEMGWKEEQIRKVQIYLNGWTDNSKMPELYSRRVTEAMAMELAAQYQATLYDK